LIDGEEVGGRGGKIDMRGKDREGGGRWKEARWGISEKTVIQVGWCGRGKKTDSPGAGRMTKSVHIESRGGWASWTERGKWFLVLTELRGCNGGRGRARKSREDWGRRRYEIGRTVGGRRGKGDWILKYFDQVVLASRLKRAKGSS